jgi:hypothetical protein
VNFQFACRFIERNEVKLEDRGHAVERPRPSYNIDKDFRFYPNEFRQITTTSACATAQRLTRELKARSTFRRGRAVHDRLEATVRQAVCDTHALNPVDPGELDTRDGARTVKLKGERESGDFGGTEREEMMDR